MLELKDICFEVQTETGSKRILDNVNFTIEGNKFVAITGPNGGGKTTLAKVLMGIVKPTSGQILWNGTDVTDMSITERANAGISFAFQQPVRFKGITVMDLISLASGKKLTVSAACAFLSEVGLCARDYIGREIDSKLSGGELKRIEIASVLARDTELAIFDEPEAGIDLWSFTNLIEVFEAMRKQKARTIMVISHQERILAIADEIVVISAGKITHHGSGEEILPKLLNVDYKHNLCKGDGR